MLTADDDLQPTFPPAIMHPTRRRRHDTRMQKLLRFERVCFWKVYVFMYCFMGASVFQQLPPERPGSSYDAHDSPSADEQRWKIDAYNDALHRLRLNHSSTVGLFRELDRLRRQLRQGDKRSKKRSARETLLLARLERRMQIRAEQFQALFDAQCDIGERFQRQLDRMELNYRRVSELVSWSARLKFQELEKKFLFELVPKRR